MSYRGRPLPRLVLAALLLAAAVGARESAGQVALAAAASRLRIPELQRPAEATLLGCSARHALCVHLLTKGAPTSGGGPRARAPKPPARPAPGRTSADSAPGRRTAWLARTLRAADGVLDAFDAMGLPPPLADDGRAGSDAYDVYLDPDASSVRTVADARDPIARSDRASAFTMTPPPGPGTSCSFQAELARSLAEAVLLGLDAAVHPSTLRMQASYLATLAVPCLEVELGAIDQAQRSPELSLGFAPADGPSGLLLLPAYLDAAYGTGKPGAVMTGLIAVSQQLTPDKAETLVDEPDAFDALRHAATARGTTLDDILLDFAVSRAFVGSRSDGAHLPDTERYGDFGRVRFEWSVPYPSLPRRLGPAWPIEPTGASYLWLDLADAPKGAELLFQAEWQSPTVFAWALVKIDRQGIEIGRVVSPAVYGNDKVQRTVADLDGLAGVLIVGVNLGSDDRSHPFDPDDPGTPAEYGVTLAASGGA